MKGKTKFLVFGFYKVIQMEYLLQQIQIFSRASFLSFRFFSVIFSVIISFLSSYVRICCTVFLLSKGCYIRSKMLIFALFTVNICFIETGNNSCWLDNFILLSEMKFSNTKSYNSFVVSSYWWFCCCSVAKLCMTLQHHGLQHARLPVLHCLLEFA